MGRSLVNRPTLIVVLAAIISGCSIVSGWFQKEPDYFQIPLQEARDMYARVDTVYKVLNQGFRTKCSRNELSASDCENLRQVSDQAAVLDRDIRMKLDNPKAQLDTAKIIRVLEILAGIASKVA